MNTCESHSMTCRKDCRMFQVQYSNSNVKHHLLYLAFSRTGSPEKCTEQNKGQYNSVYIRFSKLS